MRKVTENEMFYGTIFAVILLIILVVLAPLDRYSIYRAEGYLENGDLESAKSQLKGVEMIEGVSMRDSIERALAPDYHEQQIRTFSDQDIEEVRRGVLNKKFTSYPEINIYLNRVFNEMDFETLVAIRDEAIAEIEKQRVEAEQKRKEEERKSREEERKEREEKEKERRRNQIAGYFGASGDFFMLTKRLEYEARQRGATIGHIKTTVSYNTEVTEMIVISEYLEGNYGQRYSALMKYRVVVDIPTNKIISVELIGLESKSFLL